MTPPMPTTLQQAIAFEDFYGDAECSEARAEYRRRLAAWLRELHDLRTTTRAYLEARDRVDPPAEAATRTHLLALLAKGAP